MTEFPFSGAKGPMGSNVLFLIIKYVFFTYNPELQIGILGKEGYTG